MVKMARIAGSLLLGISLGCGGGPPSMDSGPGAPHQGNLVRIAGGQGYVEVVHKQAASPTAPMTGEVTFYFLKDDGKTPVSPAPTSGTLTVGKQKIALKPDGDGLTTPNGPALFAKSGGVDGTLSVELDGKSVNVPLGVR
jgi:hypothetical protein